MNISESVLEITTEIAYPKRCLLVGQQQVPSLGSFDIHLSITEDRP
jgi:hypothetical protein